MKKLIGTSWLAAVLWGAITSTAVAEPPERVGPNGFLLWESPREVSEISFEAGDGSPQTLADFEGKLILLNIWATWCGPCREEMPTLDALQTELGGTDFEVVALSIDRKGIEVVNEFYQEVGIEHLAPYVDPTGMASANLGAVGIPTTLLLDRQGREIGRLVGEAEWDTSEMIDFLAEIIEATQEEAP
ncbi:TlpA disulfide reductase family protein [Halomonas pacifica]|jgi:thiol-disulfide isomerase/thioredoxin|uniref:Redoxin n=1 Tax=Halomonas salipaludis TaxID=2032625 RepID=A0A2A2ERT2_9GAMM|nr:MULTISPECIES: TlpA disulfide reductase family protein [Halomonas]MDC8802714.1 TlpA disulfide reductase family protein [Halomonas pacifica]PAU74993.1 redoxin [Halomonas salipaludis]